MNALKWEYMSIQFDGSPEVDPTATPQEQLQDTLKCLSSPQQILIHLPDGSCQTVDIPNALSVETHMMNLLNQYGNAGWEAFFCKEEGYKIHWVLKRGSI